MPRANRHFLPDHVWHITRRCHEKAFLLKFARDRRRYLRWLFAAKKRCGLGVQRLHARFHGRKCSSKAGKRRPMAARKSKKEKQKSKKGV